MEKLSAQDLGVDLAPRLQTLKVMEPPKRVGGGKVRYLLPNSRQSTDAGIGRNR
jgi:electron transfer flavoprotein beta subunit